jgi:hypothetical protein
MVNMVSVHVGTPQNERQHSVNDFGCCILYNPRPMMQLLPIIEVLAAFIGNLIYVNAATPKS